MNPARLALVVWLAVAAAHTGLARAGEPDPTATAAGDANLESTARRQGTNLTLGFGGGFSLGFGIDGSVGRGGSGSLRLGQVATPRVVLTLELSGVALFHAVKTTSGYLRMAESYLTSIWNDLQKNYVFQWSA